MPLPTMPLPTMPPNEFQEGGYLQEVNRLVLHPLGLALTFATWEDQDDLRAWLQEKYGDRFEIERPNSGELIAIVMDVLGDFGIGAASGRLYVQDDRGDPEGWYFEDGPDAEKTAKIGDELLARIDPRMKKLGYVVQPVPGVDDRKSGL